jgi:hypothetical protein
VEVEDVADLIASQGDGLPFFYSGEELVLDDSDDDAAEGSAGVGGGGRLGGALGRAPCFLCENVSPGREPRRTPLHPYHYPSITASFSVHALYPLSPSPFGRW